jgi:hypothetical protein
LLNLLEAVLQYEKEKHSTSKDNLAQDLFVEVVWGDTSGILLRYLIMKDAFEALQSDEAEANFGSTSSSSSSSSSAPSADLAINSEDLRRICCEAVELLRMIASVHQSKVGHDTNNSYS